MEDRKKLIELELPFPPSVNIYWRKFKNRLVLSPRARFYIKAVGMLMLEYKNGCTGKFTALNCDLIAGVDLYPPDKRVRDVDNYCKALFDSLTKAGVIEDDKQIKEMNVKFCGTTKGGKCLLKLYEM